jgi:hypothetical protein
MSNFTLHMRYQVLYVFVHCNFKKQFESISRIIVSKHNLCQFYGIVVVHYWVSYWQGKFGVDDSVFNNSCCIRLQKVHVLGYDQSPGIFHGIFPS